MLEYCGLQLLKQFQFFEHLCRRFLNHQKLEDLLLRELGDGQYIKGQFRRHEDQLNACYKFCHKELMVFLLML